MDSLQIIIEHFEAYKKLDSAKMGSFLSHDIEFIDPSMTIVNDFDRIRFFIQFLVENMSDHTILDFKSINEVGEIVTIKWKSSYILKLNNKKIELDYTTHYTVKNGLITKQINEYDLTKYLDQAFGSFLALSYKLDRIKKMMNNQSEKILNDYIKKNTLLRLSTNFNEIHSS